MPRKPKSPQSEDLSGVSGRDLFQTPEYATDILVPFIPKDVEFIWEPACGQGKIVNRLKEHAFKVFGSDLREEGRVFRNFLAYKNSDYFDCIITNPPFSLKRKFYEKCREYDVPFALLIPADYSGWIVKATQDGCEKIIPTRRIDYITPNTLVNICKGESFERLSDYERSTFKKWQNLPETLWDKKFLWDDIYSCPPVLLQKYSSSYFHSMWLTWGFGLGKSETFVELTQKMKENI